MSAKIANNVFHFIVFVLLGILIGRESVRYEQPQFEELIKSIRENPINIKMNQILDHITLQPDQKYGKKLMGE